ncbi:hypothetical protein DFP72DRAFT_1063882 [Ephemerocybe angulata]|uniref:Uncharacterized protein n=1 Tax=Ephemerocybe angulata TaxID=980116 RepID=A0A8H6I5Y4_9AGAR|nr:hypothetical protein DFP72DRAFT_1063882 [Tulosesus angulatus]
MDEATHVDHSSLSSENNELFVPPDIIRHIATFRCIPPPCYTFNRVDDVYPLDAPGLAHHRCEWTAPELLLTSSAIYSDVYDLSWQSPRVHTVRALRSVLEGAFRPYLRRGESRTPAECIRCIDIVMELSVTQWEDVLPTLFHSLSQLRILILSDRTHSFLSLDGCSPSNVPIGPRPWGSTFPRSLTQVLLSSHNLGVNMDDLVLLSLEVPQLERLQVAKFNDPHYISLQDTVTSPSYFFPSLVWLSLGTFLRSPDDAISINSRGAKAFTTLLRALSVASGLRRLTRLDILYDIELPERFLQVHGPRIHTLSVPSKHHRSIRRHSSLSRFTSLKKLIFLLEPSVSPLAALTNPSLETIVFMNPPYPYLADVRQDAGNLRGLNDHIINEVLSAAPLFPALNRVVLSFPPSASPAEIDTFRQRLAIANITVDIIIVDL